MNGATVLLFLNLVITLKYVVTFTLRSPLTRGKELKAITEWRQGGHCLPIWKLGKLNQYFFPPRRCEEYLGPPTCILGTGCRKHIAKLKPSRAVGKQQILSKKISL